MRVTLAASLVLLAAAAAPALADHHAVGSGSSAGSFDATLEVDRARFMVSEPIYATVVYTGSHADIEESWLGQNSLARPDNYRVTFVRDGKPLAVPDAGPQMGGQSWTVELDGTRTQRTRLLLPVWVRGLAPGHYTVHAETTLRARAHGAGDTGWAQVAVAVDVPVDVVADDSAALGKVITALGDRAVTAADDSREAMSALQVVTDARAIAQWTRVAAIAEYEHKILAVWGLAKFRDDAALDVVIAVSKTQGRDLDEAGYSTDAQRDESAGMLRLSAAQGLAESPSPRAWPALIAMRGDANADVRLVIAQRSATLPRDEARKYLTTFVGDKDPRIAGEAKRLLAELTTKE
jgi:hypothetical protein|nr:hypothetical protein [Kofleriaceae bacterium]